MNGGGLTPQPGEAAAVPSAKQIMPVVASKLRDRSSQTIEQELAPAKVEATPADGWDSASYLDPSMRALEPNFNGMMLGKMMQELEQTVAEQTKMLDEMTKKSEKERKQLEKDRLTEHIPGPLKNEGRSLEDIWQLIDKLITFSNYEEDSESSSLRKAQLKYIDKAGYTCLAAHSIGAWISTLDKPHLEHLSGRILSDTSLWISRIWRFKDSRSFFHDDLSEGILAMCRIALVEKYPKLPTEGFHALYSKPPVVYLSTAGPPDLDVYLSSQLNLAPSSVCLVPNSFQLGGDECIDIVAFEQMVNNDLSVGKSPLLLLAFAGTRVTGTVDELAKLATICKSHKIWLHVEGMKLAQLALLSVPTSVQGTTTRIDSMTLDLGSWLGVPAVPYCTQFKTTLEEELLQSQGLTNLALSARLSVFPLWVAMQTMGYDGIVERIKGANALIKRMTKLLKSVQFVEIINRDEMRKQKTENGEEKIQGISSLIGTLISYLISFDTLNPIVTFRYSKDQETLHKEMCKDVAPYATNKKADIKKPKFVASQDDRYYNALNQWLCETLQGSFPKMGLSPIEVEGIGICIRFCPLETAQLRDTHEKDLENFIVKLKQHISILSATMTKRFEFKEIIMAQSKLNLVELNDWAGLGAVFYLPQSCEGKDLSDLSEEALEDLCTVNRNLVCQLRSEDGAFSLGCLHIQDVGTSEKHEVFCVRFGLITGDTDVEELIGMVLSVGIECEESNKYLEKMSEVVRKGIMTASEDLKQEHIQKLQQEGALRQVPFLDSLVNWWSPPPKDVVKGRALNLSSGEIMSTEDTYRYKMQISNQYPNSTNPAESTTSQGLLDLGNKMDVSAAVGHTVAGGNKVDQPRSYKSLLKPRHPTSLVGQALAVDISTNDSLTPPSPLDLSQSRNERAPVLKLISDDANSPV